MLSALVVLPTAKDGAQRTDAKWQSKPMKKRKPERLMSAIRDKLAQMSGMDTKVTSGSTVNDVPNRPIDPLAGRIISAFCAPNNSLTQIQSYRNSRRNIENGIINVAGVTSWDQRPDEAYGLSMSLYDHDVKLGRTVGDPIADCLSIVLRPNNSILVLADGVSWGEKSKLAAWSAVYGCTSYLMDNVSLAKTTRDVFVCMMSAFENAQSCIVEEDGTMTTLCAAVVVKLKGKDQWGLCVLNVGDSLAYVYNATTGVREVTTGSHSIDEDRDMRNAGGSLGQVDGCNPDLSNLTCSFTLIKESDIVFLTSDGISDNFDPAVAFFQPSPECLTKFNPNYRKGSAQIQQIKIEADKLLSKPRSSSFNSSSVQPKATPLERHCGSLEKMTKVIEEENPSESQVSAVSLCASLVNYALRNTQKKRQIHESMDYGRLKELSPAEKRKTEDKHRSSLDSAPGKLDHASIAALQVGYHMSSQKWSDQKSINENDYHIINDRGVCAYGDRYQMPETGYNGFQTNETATRTFCDIR